MSFENNWGKLREWGRMAVLPTNKIKTLLTKDVFDKYSVNKIIDFGAGALYWSKWFSEVVGKEKVCPVDIVFQTAAPNADMKYFTSIDEISIEPATLFYICDVMHHLPRKTWNDIKRKVFGKCDFIVIKDIDCHYKFKNFMNKMHDKIINKEKIHDVDPNILINDLKTSGYIIHMYKIHKLWYSHFMIIAQKK